MKRFLLMLLVLSALVSGIVSAAGKKEEAAAPAAPKEVKMRFSWWGGDVRHQATLKALEAYKIKNPHVTIEGEYGAFGSYLQKLLTQLTGGTAPDIFFVDFKWVFDLLAQNKDWFVNMNTMSNRIDMSGLDMNFARSWASMNDYLIGLPVGVNAVGLVYNVDLIKKAGINITDTWDWDDVLAAGAKMKQYDPGKHAVFFNQPFYMYLLKIQLKQKTGNDVVKDDYTLGVTAKDVAEVFTYIRKMVDTGTVPPFEEHVPFELIFADQTPGWLNQKYAISFTSSSHIPNIQKASKFGLDVARYPIFKNSKNPGLITAPTMMMTLNKKSPNLDEAIKFVDWFLNDEAAINILKDTRGLPAVKKARDVLMKAGVMDPLIVKLVESGLPFSGGPEGALSQNKEVVSLIDEYVHRIGYKKQTPEEASVSFIKDLTDLVADLKRRK